MQSRKEIGMKASYATLVAETIAIILFVILFPIIVLFAVDRTIAAQDYSAGVEVKGYIFEMNCNVGNFE